jgi:hypothetical protein
MPRGEAMFGIFDGRREAEQVALAINHLVQSVSHSYTTEGVDGCIELLKRIGGRLAYDTVTGKTRNIRFEILILKHDFNIGLMTNDMRPFLNISGGERYAGFEFSCGLPPRTFIAEVQPTIAWGASRRAIALVSVIQKMTAEFGG